MVKGEERGEALVAIYYIQSWKDLSRLHWLSSGSNFMRLRDLPTEPLRQVRSPHRVEVYVSSAGLSWKNN